MDSAANFAIKALKTFEKAYLLVKDPETDMVLCTCDLVLNNFEPGEIAPKLEQAAKERPQRDFVDMLIHEQYFYPHYNRYLPYFKELIEEGVQWCQNAGYEPAFIGEMLEIWDV